MIVGAGAKPRPENYGTSADLTAGFHTLMPLALETSEITMSGPSVNAILRFNHALADDSVPGNIKVPFKGYSVNNHLEVSGSWVYVSDVPAPFESRFDMQILKGITDVYGQALGKDQVEAMEVGRAATYVSFRAEGQKLLESQFPPRVAVEFQNVDSARFGGGALKEPFIQKPGGPNKKLDIRRVPKNTRHFELFDLSPYLNNDHKGAAWLSWIFTGRFDETDDTPQDVKDDLEVQVTDIGASVHIADNALVVLAGSLSTGQTLSDATVMLRKGTQRLATGTTDSAGMAALALPPGVLMNAFRGHEEDLLVEITKGTDRLVLRPSEMPSLAWNSSEPYSAEIPRPLTYIWSDRGIYRPGETVSFAGIDQNLVMGKLAPVTGKYRIDLKTDSEDAAPLATFSGTTSKSGSFSGQITLPKDAEPGDWFLSFSRMQGKEQATGQAFVKIANFRRVTYSVDLSLPDTRVYMGDTLSATFKGQYLAGGNVAQGKWSWFWTRHEQWYQPPGDNLAPYSFGAVTRPYPEDLGSQSGSLSGNGAVTATQALADGDKGRVYTYEIAATIEDIDRQAISKQDSRLVFSSDQLLGALISSSPTADDSLYFVQKDVPFTLKVVSVDPDGKPYPSGNVQGKLVREDWKLVRERGVGGVVDTHYEQEETTEKEFTVRPDRPFGSIQLSTQKAGSYALDLTGKDAKGRESYTRITFYSTGADFIRWSSTDEKQIEIVPDKKIYEPGDTARLLIKSPVAKGMFLVSVEREGIIEKRTVSLEGGAPTIDIPVKEGYLPHFYVFVATSAPRTKPPADGPDSPDFGKPRGYSGLIEIPVRTGSRLIHVDISSSKPTYLPGTQASVTVKATWQGKPLAGAEVALVAADRGVLDLIDYHIQSPLDFFYDYGNFPDRVAHYESRDLLIDPVTWKARDLPGGDEKGEAAAETSAGVNVRKNFNPTAVFRTGLVTGKDGTVTVTFKLPDSLTTFRTTAVLSKGELFGLGESSFQVQNPINVRTALPRRLRVGDSATAGVVITNLDPKARAVIISLSSADPLKVIGAARKSVQIASGASAEVAFDLQAPKEGTAHLAFDVSSDVLKERLEDQLTVASDHVNEAFTIIGKTTNAAREALVVPSSFLGAPEEGLYLTLDSTIASNLIGAVHFLEIYPYDCLEQVTSKMFARVLFPQLSSDKADLTILERFANPDGGFSYWDDPAPRRSSYYVSLRVAHLLAVASDRGFEIPDK
ncbi:MAG TPA: MG2 domain-containing protein, partial [Spirochaetia bacterium]|nr:MG2 domain-containing protein [Spirochaetia bacterium]